MTRQNLVRFLLACLLLAMLVVPVVGMASDTQAANHDGSSHFTLFQGENTEPTAVIACFCGDPGGGQGSCC